MTEEPTGIRSYADLPGDDASDLAGQIARQEQRVAVRLATVDRVLAVASGKGGVGKSLVAAALAASAVRSGRAAALLDADFSGPTAARLLGARDARLAVSDGSARPADSPAGVPFVSSELLLGRDRPLRWREPGRDGGFVWRGAQERAMLRELLSDVAWGELRWLVVDLPPGADRMEELATLAGDRLSVVAVTLPSGASRSAVARALEVAREGGLETLGVLENMSGYACPGCGALRPLFPGDAGRELAREAEVPFLGEIPFDPVAAELADRGAMGRLLEETSAGRALGRTAAALLEGVG